MQTQRLELKYGPPLHQELDLLFGKSPWGVEKPVFGKRPNDTRFLGLKLVQN